MQWTGANHHQIAELLEAPEDALTFVPDGLPGGPALRIRTLEGQQQVPEGYWVIRGVKGEFYGCAPDVFAETYYAAPQQRDGAAA